MTPDPEWLEQMEIERELDCSYGPNHHHSCPVTWRDFLPLMWGVLVIAAIFIFCLVS